MRIALDAAAGDVGLAPNIEGALRVAAQGELEVVLVGPAEDIRRELSKRGVSSAGPLFEIVDAPDVIPMSEEPAAACRAKPRASVMVCAELAESGRVSGFVSAGHSGAAMVASLWHLKRIPGVLRPAIAAAIPTPKGPCLLLDAGANTDCKPWHLLQFAAMGAIYSEHVLGVPKPRVGLLSIGEEEGKGNALVKEAIPLLRSAGLDYYGTVEGGDIAAGTTQVVVCDGFTGNVAVKLLEGAGVAMTEFFAAEVSGPAGLLLRKPLSRVRERMSYDTYGGAPLLGVNGNAVVCHGRSNAKAIGNALKAAQRLATQGVGEKIRKALDDLKQALETAKI